MSMLVVVTENVPPRQPSNMLKMLVELPVTRPLMPRQKVLLPVYVHCYSKVASPKPFLVSAGK